MLVYGRKATTYPEYPDMVVYSRWGHYYDQPLEEITVFVKEGTHGFEEGEPQSVMLPDRDGLWLMSSCENFFGQTKYVNSGMHLFDIPLAPCVKLITEEEFYKAVPEFKLRMETRKQKATMRLKQAQQQRRDDRAALLSRLGLDKNEVELLMG